MKGKKKSGAKAKGKAKASSSSLANIFTAKAKSSKILRKADGGEVAAKPVLTAAQKRQRANDQWRQSFQNWVQSGVGQRQTSVFAGFPNSSGPLNKKKVTDPKIEDPPLPPLNPPTTPTTPQTYVRPTPTSGNAGFGTPATGHFPIYTPPLYQPPLATSSVYAKGGIVTRKAPKKYI
jgi:hypothetical protein